MRKASMVFSGAKFWLILITIVLIVVVGWWVGSGAQQKSVSASDTPSSLGEAGINQTFTFDGLKADGKSTGSIKMIIEKAELNSEVLIQGKPATVRGDKVFLILNLEFENAQEEALYISPVDLIRLTGEGDKKFAPDVHSELIEVRPISVKLAKVGFVVPQSQKNFQIQVGAIEGQKQTIEFAVN